jgi:redox-sensitive bicupin YhaK (pirin superfamily)
LKVKSIRLDALGQAASPLEVFDDFRVSGSPFAPHPHAGFSAVSYIFEDSPGAVRSRDSLGGNYVAGPGGIVWSQAANGMMHEELPVDPSLEIHGLQIFVNLSAKAKTIRPAVLFADGPQVPVWRDDAGNYARIAAGTYAGVKGAVQAAERCDLLDILVATHFNYELDGGRNAFLYCETGSVEVNVEGGTTELKASQALAVSGKGLLTIFGAAARVVIISGLNLQEQVVSHGPFIMNSQDDIHAAMDRYQRGEMGHLAASAPSR